MIQIKSKVVPDSFSEYKLSAKALGILFFVISSDSRISAEFLSTQLKEGETSVTSGLKELRDFGLIQTETKRSPDGTFTKLTAVTASGYAFFAKSLSQIGTFNSHFVEIFWNAPIPGDQSIGKFLPRPNTAPYSVVGPEGYMAPSREELNEIERIETEEEQAAALKQLEENRAAYLKSQQKKQRALFKKRSAKPDKRTWTPTDVQFEFGDKIQEYWHIEPWRITKTRFRMILADYRNKFNTNGLIECAMIEAFFELEEVSKFTDANFLMMRFFRRFSELNQYVISRDLALTDEEKSQVEQRNQETAERSWRRMKDWMDEDDDSRAERAVKKANWERYSYLAEQRKLDHSVGILTDAELAIALASLDQEFQPR